MQEDLAALKKGQAPVGFQIEKQSEKEIKPAQPTVPQPISRPPTPSHVELGRLEKSKPLPGTRMPAGLPSIKLPGQQQLPPSQPSGQGGLTGPTIAVPSAASLLNRLGNFGSRKLLWGGVGLIVIIVVVVVFVFLRAPAEPVVTFSPTPEITATPTPSTPFIERAFAVYSPVNLGVGPDIFVQLLSSVNTEVLAGGEPGLYKIVDPQSGQQYSLDSFMSSALVILPEEIKPFVENQGIYLSLMKKATGDYSYGFAVKLTIAETDSLAPDQATMALGRWEMNIATNIKTLFDLDIDKAASVDFADNTYQGVAIRYRNFPNPLKTIDYVVVTAANGDKYMVFTNSREHMYAIIDNLK